MNIAYNFTDHVALITGAGAGMGFATAQAFARAGANVVLLDLPGDTLDAAVASLSESSGQIVGLGVDVTQADQIAGAVHSTVERFGRIDSAFNNAGIIAAPSDIADTLVEDFDRVQQVNLRGVWLSVKYEMQQMRAQGFGSIVNCSSISGLKGTSNRSEYGASKFGILGLTRSVALDSGPYGVRVNAVCPGTIETPMVSRMAAAGELDRDSAASGAALQRLGRPEEIADAVLWLSSDAASYVTGVALPVDGGLAA